MKRIVNGLSVYEAELDYPVGVNASYGCGKQRFFKNSAADKWSADAMRALKEQGFEPLEDRPYWCSVRYTLHSVRMDVDGPIKAIIDVIARSLCRGELEPGKKKPTYVGFNDKWVGSVESRKVLVSHYNEQKLTIRVIIGNVDGKEAFNSIGERLADDTILRLATKLSKEGGFKCSQ